MLLQLLFLCFRCPQASAKSNHRYYLQKLQLQKLEFFSFGIQFDLFCYRCLQASAKSNRLHYLLEILIIKNKISLFYRLSIGCSQLQYTIPKAPGMVFVLNLKVLGYYLSSLVSSFGGCSVLRARLWDLRFCRLALKLFFKRSSRSFAFLLLFVIFFKV